MLNLDQYNFAVFDCDGVIIDSNLVKTEAFRLALQDLGETCEVIDVFLNYHKANGGISRFAKLEHLLVNIKKVPLDQNYVDQALKLFAKHVMAGLLSCDEIPGIRKVLAVLQSRNIPAFVISGGEQSEVRDVLTKRDFSNFFEEILGSPIAKETNLITLINKRELKTPGIFFGDAQADMLAAEKTAMDFILISGKSEWREGINVCTQRGHRILRSFEEG